MRDRNLMNLVPLPQLDPGDRLVVGQRAFPARTCHSLVELAEHLRRKTDMLSFQYLSGLAPFAASTPAVATAYTKTIDKCSLVRERPRPTRSPSRGTRWIARARAEADRVMVSAGYQRRTRGH